MDRLKLLAMVILALCLGSGALAEGWSASSLKANEQTIYSFASTDTLGFSGAIAADKCGSATTGWSKGATASTAAGQLYACPLADSVIADCTLLSSYGANASGTVVLPGMPYLKFNRATLPSAGTPARLYMFCSQSAGGGGGATDSGFGRTTGFSLLIAGDVSIVNGRPYDELWATQGSQDLQNVGYVTRSRNASGIGMAVNDVEAAYTLSTGELFGPAPYFDLLAYVRKNPIDLKDVILMVGTSDYIQPCSHSPSGTFDPNLDPGATVCTPEDTIENLEYLMGQLSAMGVASYWFVPTGWAGKFTQDAAPGAATYDEAITTVHAALVTFCAGAGQLCFSGDEMYKFACAGDVTLPDPTSPTDCSATNNSYDLDNTGVLANVTNAPFLFGEDFPLLERISGAGLPESTYHLHPSGMGYTEFNRVMWADINTAPSLPGFRLRQVFGVGVDNIDWTARPAVPIMTLSAITATSVTVKVDRGVFVNGQSGTLGQCGKQGDCEYICWATCEDPNDTSTDPACATTATGNTPDFREPGTPNGAAHYSEGTNNVYGQRNILRLRNGNSGILAGLHTATTYGVYCVAVSPTSVSHPAAAPLTTL